MKKLIKTGLIAFGLITMTQLTFAAECIIDLQKATNTCDTVKEINLINSPVEKDLPLDTDSDLIQKTTISKTTDTTILSTEDLVKSTNEMLFHLDMTPTNGKQKKAIFEIQYVGEPETYYNTSEQAWTVNIGDSITNNGWAGDGKTQSNDAELQVSNTNFVVWASDYGNSEKLYQKSEIFGENNQTPGGYKLKIAISDGQIERYNDYEDGQRRNKETIQSPYLFALNGQNDTEGEINYNVYAAFNRVIANTLRNGNGVAIVTISIVDVDEKPDLTIEDMYLAAGYGYTEAAGYGWVDIGETEIFVDTEINNIDLGESDETFVTCYPQGDNDDLTYPITTTPIMAAFSSAESRIKFYSSEAQVITQTPGLKVFDCEVDGQNIIAETNEDNNSFEFVFGVTGSAVPLCEQIDIQLVCMMGSNDCPAECSFALYDGESTNEEVSAGTYEVYLGTFTVEHEGAPSTLQSLTIKNNGNLDYHNLTNVKLYTSDDELIDIEDLNVNNELVFIDINKTLNKDFYLVGDLSSNSPVGKTLNLDLIDATAVKTSTNEVISNQNLPQDLNNITIAQNAILTVYTDGNTPESKILVANTDENEVAKFQIGAVNDDILVKDLRFKNIASNYDSSRITYYELFVNGTQIGSQVPVDGAIHFNLGTINGFTINEDDSVIITIKADLNSISDDTQTNKEVKLEITDIRADAITNGMVVGSANNGVKLNYGDHYTTSYLAAEDIQGELMYIRKTVPVVSTASLGTNQLINGRQTIYSVNISADQNEDIRLDSITLQTAKQGITIINTSTEIFVNGIQANIDGRVMADDRIMLDFENHNIIIPAGTTKKIDFSFEVYEVDGDDYLSVNIDQANEMAAGTRVEIQHPDNQILRSDNSGNPNSSDSSSRFNGYLVPGLATTTTTLTAGTKSTPTKILPTSISKEDAALAESLEILFKK